MEDSRRLHESQHELCRRTVHKERRYKAKKERGEVKEGEAVLMEERRDVMPAKTSLNHVLRKYLHPLQALRRLGQRQERS